MRVCKYYLFYYFNKAFVYEQTVTNSNRYENRNFFPGHKHFTKACHYRTQNRQEQNEEVRLQKRFIQSPFFCFRQQTNQQSIELGPVLVC